MLLAWSAVASTGCQFSAMGQNAHGARLYQQGQYQAALQEFQKAAASSPTNPDSYYNMAATMHRLGSQQNDKALLAQAETLYNQCLDLSPDHVDCHRGLAVLLVETDRQDRAFNLLKNWATRSPQLADARVELARLYEEFGDMETAKLQLYQAVQLDPNHQRALMALGRQREKAGDLQQALANYQRAYSLNNMQPQLAERIASLQRTIAGQAPGTTAGGTRLVNTAPTTRY